MQELILLHDLYFFTRTTFEQAVFNKHNLKHNQQLDRPTEKERELGRGEEGRPVPREPSCSSRTRRRVASHTPNRTDVDRPFSIFSQSDGMWVPLVARNKRCSSGQYVGAKGIWHNARKRHFDRIGVVKHHCQIAYVYIIVG
nr:uncharacterized protein LOC113826406 [Penaeus vannamei]